MWREGREFRRFKCPRTHLIEGLGVKIAVYISTQGERGRKRNETKPVESRGNLSLVTFVVF